LNLFPGLASADLPGKMLSRQLLVATLVLGSTNAFDLGSTFHGIVRRVPDYTEWLPSSWVGLSEKLTNEDGGILLPPMPIGDDGNDSEEGQELEFVRATKFQSDRTQGSTC
jgi:hypothetical protein